MEYNTLQLTGTSLRLEDALGWAIGDTMAGRVEAIYRLQLTDTEIDEKRNALRAIESQLADEEDVLAARGAVRRSEETLQKSMGRLRGLEMDLDEIVAKIASAEKGLYGGEVTNPKELAGMEQELEYLRRRRSLVEDDTLSIMAEVEEQRDALRIAEEQLAGAEQHWQALQGELQRDAEVVRSRIASLEGERKEIPQKP